ncbi:MAG: hypothetical protein ACK4UN_07280 [Limisphaerales bacterium]
MGLFKKKADPISERSKALKEEIAALEAQIRELSARGPANNSSLRKTAATTNAVRTAPAPAVRPNPKVAIQDFKLEADPVLAPEMDTPIEKPGVITRVVDAIRGKPTRNPKLVTFLAAGSIQGLRPLRYEKRVARNRFILLSLILLAFLWGILAVFLKNN